MPTTIEVPLELDIVDASNANAFWTRQDCQSGYQGVYRFTSGVHPHSKMVFKGPIPKNLAGTPAWNLVIHHAGQAGAQGANRVLLRVEANVFASGDTPGARTVIVPNQLVGVGASGDRNITVLSATNFDSLLALTAGDQLRIEFMRAPNAGSGDIAGNWDLYEAPILRCDVT
jgi:hypothetical protein